MRCSLKTILTCCLIAAALNTIFAQDPVKLSPQFYKVLIDNDEMRVLEFHFKPGEKEPMHSHPRGFVYALRPATPNAQVRTHPAAGTPIPLGRLQSEWPQAEETTMGFGRGALLWLLGIPLPIIILLALFWR